MRLRVLLCLVFLTAVALAKEPKAYMSGKVLQMDSVACGTSEKDAKNLAGEMIGTDSGNKKTQEVLCQEYVVQGERVVFRIRPRDEKHPVLLPVGERAQFRLEKDKMMLRMEELDNKEHQYTVVSMSPRSDSDSADATATRVNHLQ